MDTALSELIDLLTPKPTGSQTFVARSDDPGWGRLYGGQVMAQALGAAEQTVDSGRCVHSLHAYFLRLGRPDVPLDIDVDATRDGRSVSTRRVTVSQGSKAILTLMASFQGNEAGLEHGEAPPEVPPPDDLVSMAVLSRKVLDQMPEGLSRALARPAPFEIRPVLPYNPMQPDVRPPVRQTWYRASHALPDDPALHRRLLAWAADSHFLTTATQPHGVSWMTPGMQVASIDHAMWFHRDFRADEWLLYDVVSPTLSNSRALVRGRFFNRAGQLVATTAQEGLIRDRRRG